MRENNMVKSAVALSTHTLTITTTAQTIQRQPDAKHLQIITDVVVGIRFDNSTESTGVTACTMSNGGRSIAVAIGHTVLPIPECRWYSVIGAETGTAYIDQLIG